MKFVKSINIKDVVYVSAAAWDDIPASTLMKSWNNLLRFQPQSSPSDDQSSSSAAPNNASTEDRSVSLSTPDEQTTCELLAEQLNANLTVDDGNI